MSKMSLLYFDRRSRKSNSFSFPPAFTIASPSLELGEAMVKVGGMPSCRAGAEPRPLFFSGKSAAITVLFAPWPAEAGQVDSALLA
jgi:hypothetical protein